MGAIKAFILSIPILWAQWPKDYRRSASERLNDFRWQIDGYLWEIGGGR